MSEAWRKVGPLSLPALGAEIQAGYRQSDGTVTEGPEADGSDMVRYVALYGEAESLMWRPR